MTILGGGLNGFVPRQTVTARRDGESALFRSLLRRSNNSTPGGIINGYARRTGPYRFARNLADPLSRTAYVCGVSNQITRGAMPGKHMSFPRNQCDGSGVRGTSSNVKFVADASDYIRFKKENAINDTYNDSRV